MGDAENAFPSSKKPAAGRELSRDNLGTDDEDECPGQEASTFKRASDDVLANRRIVKVKRGQTSSTSSAPSSNPFAAVRLVPSANSTPAIDPEKLVVGNDENTPVTEEEKNGNKDELEGNDGNTPASEKQNGENKDELDENDENTPASGTEDVENKDRVAGNDESTPAAETEKNGNKDELEGIDGNTPASLDAKDGNTPASGEKNIENTDNVSGNDESTPVAEKEKNESKEKVECNDENTPDEKIDNVGEKVNLEGNDKNTPAVGSVNSFQQLSSSQNAFSGLVGTGFSGSSFSFGSISKADPPVFPSFSFGTNGNSSIFGNTDKNMEGTKTIPSFKEEQLETGEENEKAVFTADAALFEFIASGWKERGKGELKVNVLTSVTRRARLVMRARGNYRLMLNASLFPDMKLTNMEKKGISFACLNTTGEGQNGLSTFALKFKDASIVDEFCSVVTAHKGPDQ